MNAEDKRNRAAAIFRILGIIQFLLGFLLLILGGVGQAFHGKSDSDGAHYYSSAFLVGGFVIVLSVLDIVIYCRGKQCYSRERAKQRMTCLLQVYAVVVALNFVSCGTGLVITVLSGICKGDNCIYQENQDTNFGIAVTILVSTGIVFFTCVFGLIILCTHGSHFGITLFKRGQNRISNTSSSPVSTTGIGPFFIPTGQEEDEVRRTHAELGVSLQTQLQRQNEIDLAKLANRPRTSSSIPELPPIRGNHSGQMFPNDHRSYSSQSNQSPLPSVFRQHRRRRVRQSPPVVRQTPPPPPPPPPPRPPIRIPTAWMSSSDDDSSNDSPPPPYTP